MWKYTLWFAIILITQISLCTGDEVLKPVTSILTHSKEAAPGEFPAAVGLRTKFDGDFIFCGGTIIGKKWVITRAQCTRQFLTNPDFGKKNGVYPIAVMAGEVGLLRLNQADRAHHVRLVTDIMPHPKWRHGKYENNVALLRVNYDFMLDGIFVKALELNDQKLENGDQCTLSGWAVTEATNQKNSSTKLFFLDIKYIDKTDCLKAVKKDPTARGKNYRHQSILCAGDPKSLGGLCNADFGSGLVCHDQLVGVANFGGCGNSPTGISGYEDIKHHLPWIKKVMNRFDGKKPLITHLATGNSQTISESKTILFLLFILVRLTIRFL